MKSADDSTFSVRVEVDSEGNAPAELTLAGELDAHAAGQLDEAIDSALGAGAVGLVIDLDGVTFIDSSGLRSLIRARQRLGDDPDALALRNPQAATIRLLEITGLTDHFPIR
jgi:anti-anti-sigma factor